MLTTYVVDSVLNQHVCTCAALLTLSFILYYSDTHDRKVMAEVALEKAKIAEQAERYEDMAESMRTLAEKGCTFTVEERNLLSVAYKNVVGTKRSAWRVLTALETKESENTEKKELIKNYKETIEKELKTVCNAVVALLDDYLIKKDDGAETVETHDIENKVFYLKMKGDYYRYLAEMNISGSEFVEKSKEAYDAASSAAEGLKETNPIRLGLALNFSVFHYEIRRNPKEATKLAKSAFDRAIAEMDRSEEDSYKDSTLIMQLLRDNLTLWDTTDEDDADADDQ